MNLERTLFGVWLALVGVLAAELAFHAHFRAAELAVRCHFEVYRDAYDREACAYGFDPITRTWADDRGGR